MSAMIEVKNDIWAPDSSSSGVPPMVVAMVAVATRSICEACIWETKKKIVTIGIQMSVMNKKGNKLEKSCGVFVINHFLKKDFSEMFVL